MDFLHELFKETLLFCYLVIKIEFNTSKISSKSLILSIGLLILNILKTVAHIIIGSATFYVPGNHPTGSGRRRNYNILSTHRKPYIK